MRAAPLSQMHLHPQSGLYRVKGQSPGTGASEPFQNSAKTQSGLAPGRTGWKPVPRTTPLKVLVAWASSPCAGVMPPPCT